MAKWNAPEVIIISIGDSQIIGISCVYNLFLKVTWNSHDENIHSGW